MSNQTRDHADPPAPPRQPPDAVLSRELAAWLDSSLSAEVKRMHLVQDLVEEMLGLRSRAHANGLDLYDPADVAAMAVMITDDDPAGEGPLGQLTELRHLATFATFRSAQDGGAMRPDWDQAFHIVDTATAETQEFLDRTGPPALPPRTPLFSTFGLDPEERLAALREIRPVAAVPRLLAWVGTGRGVTPSGGITRADIHEVAGMLGIPATGVDERSGPAQPERSAPDLLEEMLPAPRLVRALSMFDVPLLAAWWEALWTFEIVERRRSRLLPGPAAPEWSAQSELTSTAAEHLVAVFLAHLFTPERRRPGAAAWMERSVRDEALRRIAFATLPAEADPPADLAGPVERPCSPRALDALRDLEHLGLLTVTPDGTVDVPLLLRPAVSFALDLITISRG